VGRQDRWWEAEGIPGYYWPDSIARDGTVKSAIALFELLGFDICDNGEIEPGYGKVALYGDSGSYTHVARQLENGKWTSKIGRLHDIEHDSLDGLVGQEYGLVINFLKKRRST